MPQSKLMFFGVIRCQFVIDHQRQQQHNNNSKHDLCVNQSSRISIITSTLAHTHNHRLIAIFFFADVVAVSAGAIAVSVAPLTSLSIPLVSQGLLSLFICLLVCYWLFLETGSCKFVILAKTRKYKYFNRRWLIPMKLVKRLRCDICVRTGTFGAAAMNDGLLAVCICVRVCVCVFVCEKEGDCGGMLLSSEAF